MGTGSGKLLELCNAQRGITCIVGAGGKKTTLLRLAAQHRGRVAITATVQTPPFRKRLQAEIVVAPADALEPAVLAASRRNRRVAYAHPGDKPARLQGVTPERVVALHQAAGFELTLIKADGARLRWAKAPDVDEPRVPAKFDALVAVVSIRALGKPLTSDVVHRPELFADITGATLGEPIKAVHLGQLLASPRGGMKNCDHAAAVGLVNMVETREQKQTARLVAEQALAVNDRLQRVLIGSMLQDDPVVAVVER